MLILKLGNVVNTRHTIDVITTVEKKMQYWFSKYLQ